MPRRRRDRRRHHRRRLLVVVAAYCYCVASSVADAAALSFEEASANAIVDPNDTRFVAMEERHPLDPPSHSTTDSAVSGESGIGRSARGLRDALADTRRILEYGDDVDNHHSGGGGDGELGLGQQQRRGQRRPSSDWWSRLYQGGPLYNENTGKLIRGTVPPDGENSADGGVGGGSIRPENRRSHSAAVYRQHTIIESDDDDGGAEGGPVVTATATTREWMIVSGGFTDDDWNTFPVWAYDLSGGRSIAEVKGDRGFFFFAATNSEEEGGGGRNDDDDARYSPWVELTSAPSGDDATFVDDVPSSSPESASSAANVGAVAPPRGRVGHLSSVHDGCLYVFGGLTYRMGSFRVDDPAEDDDGRSEGGGGGGGGAEEERRRDEEPIAIWKACGLDELLSHDGRKENGKGKGGLEWERVVANVDSRPPSPPAAAGDSKVTEDDDGNEEEDGDPNGRRRTTGALSVPPTRQYSSARSSSSSSSSSPRQLANSHSLPRGEAQGGEHHDGRSSFVFHGGMRRRGAELAETQTTEPNAVDAAALGDVWRYDYDEETLRLLSPYPPLEWQRDERNGGYPKARTAHAATVTDGRLILHGGMHFGGPDDPDDLESESPSSFSSPSSTYATYRTSSRWRPLADVWEFDLRTLRWRERLIYPQLARSYHSMVGWGNGTVAAFGGFQQDSNIPGETVAFVFKDLLLSRPNETNWHKLVSPQTGGALRNSPWRASEYVARPGITNRLEHTAVLDEHGSMYVWGGRFQTVGQIFGLWRLDVFARDARLTYEAAPPDGIEEYEAELEALHMFIATMMFMSLTISSLFSILRRGGDGDGDDDGTGVGAGGRRSSRRGLSQQTIDSLPLKRYEAAAPAPNATREGAVAGGTSLGGENGRSNDEDDDAASAAALEENLECCAICLVPYEHGVSEIRTLPCGHCFDRECIDSWFMDHTTCPSCRQNVDDSDAPSVEEEEAERRAGHAATTGRWRYHSHWGNSSAEEEWASSTTDEAIRDQHESDSRWGAIREQHEAEPRWQFITGFDGLSRRRHSYWDDGQNSEQPATLDSSIDASQESSHSNEDEEPAPNNARDENVEDEHPMMYSIIGPRLLGLQRFFSKRGHVGVIAVPGEDDGEDEESEDIELV